MDITQRNPLSSALQCASQTACGLESAEVNINEAERRLSLLAGSALTLFGVRRLGSLRGLAVAAIGGSLVYRGLSGHCTLYKALGISTKKESESDNKNKSGAKSDPSRRGVRIEQSIFINCAPAEVYRYWRNVENLPRFMTHLESVTVHPDGHSHWIAKAPFGSQLEWDAHVVQERENELIVWRSLEGSEVDMAGTVEFRPLAYNRGTEVHVALSYDPPPGRIGISLAQLFSGNAKQEIREDLERLKRAVETGEAATTANQFTPNSNPATGESFDPPQPGHALDEVDEASMESFPGSDPPAWTATSAMKAAGFPARPR